MAQSKDEAPGAAPTSIKGTARNAKAGAVILGPDGEPTCVPGLDSWPPALDGKAVIATGILRDRKVIPSPVVGPDGARSAGASGNQAILEDARWWLAPAWKARIAEAATVIGIARNAKAGAILDTPEGPAYVGRLPRWPPELLGKPVTVTTASIHRNKWPRSPENDDSQWGGQAGERWVLSDPTWSAAGD